MSVRLQLIGHGRNLHLQPFTIGCLYRWHLASHWLWESLKPVIIAHGNSSGKKLPCSGRSFSESTLPWVWRQVLFLNSSLEPTGVTTHGSSETSLEHLLRLRVSLLSSWKVHSLQWCFSVGRRFRPVFIWLQHGSPDSVQPYQLGGYW